MTYTVQPPSGTALSSTWAAKGIVFARNEADTATADTIGTAVRTTLGSGPSWGTDAGGRYKQAGTGTSPPPLERWAGITFGPEWTAICVVKRVNNGGFQSPLDSDDGGSARNFILRFDDTGALQFIPFDSTGANYGPGSPSAVVSTTAASVIVVRVRLSAGTYKAQAFVDGVAGTEVSAATTGGTVTTGEYFAVATDRVGGNALFNSKSYATVIANTGFSDADVAAVSANPWVVWNDPAGGGTVTAPTISTQPAAQSVTAPATATFSVSAANGGGTLTYQWQRSNDGGTTWANVSAGTGGTSASYTTAATSAGDSGAKFRVTATNSNSGVTSNAVTLTVSAAAGTGATITSAPLKNTGGTLLPSTTIPFVLLFPLAALPSITGVVVKSAVVTNGSGVFSIQDSGLTAGNAYMAVLTDSTGAAYGMQPVTAA